MTNKFRYLPLAVILSATPVLAQEDDEQEIRIELANGGSPAVSTQGNAWINSVVATPDGSVWYRNDEFIVFCSVDEEGEPNCKQIELEY